MIAISNGPLVGCSPFLEGCLDGCSDFPEASGCVLLGTMEMCTPGALRLTPRKPASDPQILSDNLANFCCANLCHFKFRPFHIFPIARTTNCRPTTANGRQEKANPPPKTKTVPRRAKKEEEGLV